MPDLKVMSCISKTHSVFEEAYNKGIRSGLVLETTIVPDLSVGGLEALFQTNSPPSYNNIRITTLHHQSLLLFLNRMDGK